jgi:hypothetical protein
MKLGDVFVTGIVLLQASASLAYAWQRNYREAGVWLFAALSNAAYLTLVRG